MTSSAVLQFPPLPPEQSEAHLRQKLAWYADAWDLAQDLAQGIEEIVAIDTRSAEQYQAGHICGAVSFPHRTMTAETLAVLDRSRVYVTYCDGIGCNGSTKGAWKLAAAGFQVKELIGGLDFWLRDGHPVATGDAPGSWPAAAALPDCGC
ncbi:rhodanese-like domain-containing protein [Pantoea coffeiphila]|uniref:rhodanese-like domain-containing protein n=1 Tax=Pantoea coffeiphila TaxID=1465635 RepID=UPI00195F5D21|nr:rhodanese-like domain-containing protein [Pantoea coffeiphila]MBM7343959.1 rhodanese-related sulfurtransferase [Pantoea coffeiphila]